MGNNLCGFLGVFYYSAITKKRFWGEFLSLDRIMALLYGKIVENRKPNWTLFGGYKVQGNYSIIIREWQGGKMYYKDKILNLENIYYQKQKENNIIENPWQREYMAFVSIILTIEIAAVLMSVDFLIGFEMSNVLYLLELFPVMGTMMIDRVIFGKYWNDYNNLRLITLDQVIENELKVRKADDTLENRYIAKMIFVEEFVIIYKNRIRNKLRHFGLHVFISFVVLVMMIIASELKKTSFNTSSLLKYGVIVIIQNTSLRGWLTKKAELIDKDYFLKLIDDRYPKFIREKYIKRKCGWESTDD